VRLAREGASGLTLVDVSPDGVAETRALVSRANPSCVALVRVADVGDAGALASAFAAHVRRFGSMHACFNNAGIGERADWRQVVNVNVNAVVQGTRLAVDAMVDTESAAPGDATKTTSVVNVASAGGVFPMPQAPVYSATKAAVVLFSRSLEHLHASKGVRVNALCPQFTDTALVGAQFEALGEEKAGALLAQTGGSLLSVEQVVAAAMELVRGDGDDRPAGQALAVMNAGGGVAAYVPTPNPKFWKPLRVDGLKRGRDATKPTKKAERRHPPPSPVPDASRRVVVHRLTSDFAAATRIVSAPTPAPKRGEVLIERRWTGVNASDVNFTAGRYFGGAKKAAALLPFDAGFESVGVVAALGPGVADAHPELTPGQPVATTTYGGFSEYAVAPAKLVVPVPEASPAAVALLTSGLTASIAMEQLGGVSAFANARGGAAPSTPEKRRTVLVTAAAGGTGQIAVQLAKLAGHHVVATCGGEEKARMLAGLGVDRVVNYKKESLKRVLRSEYKRGVDLAYESVGGEMFETAVDALAPHGVLIVIGMMSQYTSGGTDASEAWTPSVYKGLPEKLLWKSASVRGFFLPQYARHFRRHLAGLFELVRSGKMRVEIDPSPFKGLEDVSRAVAHLQGGTSMGKVVVDVRSPAKIASRM
jgi:NADPH:quinone reductase-like Zn-dependent oxidoreductase/short-subunit dehydrogenase involved in D-alanine esterification of teichoic acids